MTIQIKPGYSVFVVNCPDCKVFHGGIRLENEEHTMAACIIDADTSEEAFKELSELDWKAAYEEFDEKLAEARALNTDINTHDKSH